MSNMRPEDDINRSHLSGGAPPRSWSPGQHGLRPGRPSGPSAPRARRVVPALPPPAARELSPRRQKLQYVLVGWVLGLLTIMAPVWIATAMHTH
jgi:hypothetical protein